MGAHAKTRTASKAGRKTRMLLVAFFAIGIAGSLASTAKADAKTETLTELRQLKSEVSRGVTPTVRQEVIDRALDSTRNAARAKHCANDRLGRTLDPTGEWEDADWYGKANPVKTGLDSPEALAEAPKYRKLLSWKTGYCYLTTSKTGGTPWPSAARKGAAARIQAAIAAAK